MENINFMQELAKIVLDALRKQAFPVIILFSAVVGLLYVVKGQKDELTAEMNKRMVTLEQKVAYFSHSLEECDAERRRLEIEVAEFRASLRSSAFRKQQ